jgi:hypothetical protein
MIAIPNQFTTFKLSQEETLQGSVLNFNQKAVIQNQIADVCEQILGLSYNPSEPLKFVQQDAELKGQLAILRFILLRSEESENQLKSLQQS